MEQIIVILSMDNLKKISSNKKITELLVIFLFRKESQILLTYLIGKLESSHYLMLKEQKTNILLNC